MMMVGAPLVVTSAEVVTIICSKRLWITMTWYARYSGVSDAAAGK